MITITINVSDEEGMTVEGFPKDPIVAYGLLKLATLTIEKYFSSQTSTTIIPVRGVIPRGGGN